MIDIDDYGEVEIVVIFMIFYDCCYCDCDRGKTKSTPCPLDSARI